VTREITLVQMDLKIDSERLKFFYVPRVFCTNLLSLQYKIQYYSLCPFLSALIQFKKVPN
jgi:hypothetical protein